MLKLNGMKKKEKGNPQRLKQKTGTFCLHVEEQRGKRGE